MRKTRLPAVAGAIVLLCLAAAVAVAAPQRPRLPAVVDPAPAGWWKPPADVRTMLRQIGASNLERYDRTLVGFGTRHTLSTQTDPQRAREERRHVGRPDDG